MSRIVRWDTPFTDGRDPSVGLLVSTEPPYRTDLLKAVVAPNGVRRVSKVSGELRKNHSLHMYGRSMVSRKDFDYTKFEEKNLCAYQYLDSPWLKSYENGINFIAGGHPGPFYHYLIFGGDNNVEVITPNVPTVEIVEKRGVLLIEYEV